MYVRVGPVVPFIVYLSMLRVELESFFTRLPNVEARKHSVVSIKGLKNFRDLGGLATSTGKVVKRGVLYRSDQLAGVPAVDAAEVLVGQLHLHHSYDLRGEGEASANMYAIKGLTRHPFGFDVAHVVHCEKNVRTMTFDDAYDWLRRCYVYLVEEGGRTAGALVKNLLSQHLSAANAAVVHCTAGKDRTGFICYLILALLDVKSEEIRDDYLLTNTMILGHYPQLRDKYSAVVPFNLVTGLFLKEVTSRIETDYGSIRNYATEAMRLTLDDIEHLKEMLLEDATK